MPIQIMQPIPPPTPMTIADVVQRGLALGGQIQAARALPQQLQQEAAQRQAQLGLTQAQIGAIPTESALRQAQTQQLLQRVALGIPTGYAPGAAGQAQAIHVLETQYGKGSPEVQMANQIQAVETHYKQQRGNYYAANLLLKNIPPFQKEQLILQVQRDTGKPISEIRQELSGDIEPEPISFTSEPLNPLSANPNTVTNPDSQAHAIASTYFPSPTETKNNQNQVAQTESMMGKQVGVTAARQQLVPLLDILKTINAVDFSPVAPFAGIHGRSQATIERSLAAAGQPVSPAFQKYNLFVRTQAKVIADAVRRALATSVRNQYVKTMILPLTQVVTWTENPQMAMQRFEYFRQWLNDRARVLHYMGTKGISPSLNEMDKVLGLGMTKGSPYPTEAQRAQTLGLGAMPPTMPTPSPDLAKYTQKDIEDTAKAHNISVAQVKQRLGL